MRLNRAFYVEQSTDQGLGLIRRGSFSKIRPSRFLPILLNVKPKMQLLNLTQQRNGGSTCTKIARLRGVRTANTPTFHFVCTDTVHTKPSWLALIRTCH